MNDLQDHDPDLALVEAVYDALDDGRASEALLITQRAIGESAEDDPVLHFLAGVALLELDRPEDAAQSFRRATELDPDDAEFRASLAEALYRCCEFGDAEVEARAAVAADESLPQGHWMLGLLLERRGDPDEAERELARAAELAPQEIAAPRRVSREEFETHLAAAIAAVPEEFRRHLDDVAVSVEELPSDEILRAESPPLDPELLGLFIGVPRSDRSVFSPGGELPPRIVLFKRNLERFALDDADLRDQIGVTLRHELAHYLGLDEEEIERAGHG